MITWIKKKLGWRVCPICMNFARIKTEKVPLVFDDEPPMLIRLECTKCGASSEPFSTTIADNAARKLGYDNFMEAIWRQNK